MVKPQPKSPRRWLLGRHTNLWCSLEYVPIAGQQSPARHGGVLRHGIVSPRTGGHRNSEEFLRSDGGDRAGVRRVFRWLVLCSSRPNPACVHPDDGSGTGSRRRGAYGVVQARVTRVSQMDYRWVSFNRWSLWGLGGLGVGSGVLSGRSGSARRNHIQRTSFFRSVNKRRHWGQRLRNDVLLFQVVAIPGSLAGRSP